MGIIKRLKDFQLLLALVAAPVTVYFLTLFFPVASFSTNREDYLVFMNLVLISAVVEELLFRGVLYETLKAFKIKNACLGKITKYNIITSVIFVICHFYFHNPFWALSVIVPSLLFGYFRERHKSVVTPIVLHIFYNFCYFSVFEY